MYILDPILSDNSELIIDDKLIGNTPLIEIMKQDLLNISASVKEKIFESMLNMHQRIFAEIGNLDISLSSTDEILKYTEPLYVIFDDQSSEETRFIRFHYTAVWETFLGVEVIILNGEELLYVGNCGYISQLKQALQPEVQKFNYIVL